MEREEEGVNVGADERERAVEEIVDDLRIREDFQHTGENDHEVLNVSNHHHLVHIRDDRGVLLPCAFQIQRRFLDEEEHHDERAAYDRYDAECSEYLLCLSHRH